MHIRTRKVRGVKKDQNNAFIRLADAFCGLVRDAIGGNPWAKGVLQNMVDKKVVVEL